MTASPGDLLTRGGRCFLGAIGRAGPGVAATAFWFDGQALWMVVALATLPAVGGSRARDCVAYVPPSNHENPGMIVHGRGRVYGRHDPLGLVLHTATISTAMTALAARNTTAALRVISEAARAPHRWLPRDPLVVRLVVAQRTAVDPPDLGPGVAPPLPPVVPADVRRALGGLRRVVVVWDEGGPRASPAVWGAGYTLRTPPTLRPPAGARVVVTVDAEGRHPGRPVGLALHGVVDPDGRLAPERVTSWCGWDVATAETTRPAQGGVVLPD